MKKHLKRLIALTLASVMLIQSPAVGYAKSSETGGGISDGQATSGNQDPNKKLLGYGFRVSFVDSTGNLYTWRDADGNTHRTTGIDVLNEKMWNNVKGANKIYVMKYSTDGTKYSNRKWPKTITDNDVYKSKVSSISWEKYSETALNYKARTGVDMPRYTAQGRTDAEAAFNKVDKNTNNSPALFNMIQNGGKADSERDEESILNDSFKLMIDAGSKAFTTEDFGATGENKNIAIRYFRSSVAMIAMNTYKCADNKSDSASGSVTLTQEGKDDVVQYIPDKAVFSEEGAKALYNYASVYNGIDYFSKDSSEKLVQKFANVKRDKKSYTEFKAYFEGNFGSFVHPWITENKRGALNKNNWQSSQDLVYYFKYLWASLTGNKVSTVGKKASEGKYVKTVDEKLQRAITAYKNYQANQNDEEAEADYKSALKAFDGTRKNLTTSYLDYTKKELLFYYKSLKDMGAAEGVRQGFKKLDYAVSSLHMTSLEDGNGKGNYTKSVYYVAEPIVAIGREGGTVYVGSISEFMHNSKFLKMANWQTTFMKKQVAKSMFPGKTVIFSNKAVKNYKGKQQKTQKITYDKKVLEKAQYTPNDVKKHLGICYIGARTSFMIKSPAPKPIEEEEEPLVSTRTIKAHENTTIYLNGSITVKSEVATYQGSNGYFTTIQMGQPGTLGKVINYTINQESLKEAQDEIKDWNYTYNYGDGYSGGASYWWTSTPYNSESFSTQTDLQNKIDNKGSNTYGAYYDSDYTLTDDTYYWYVAACFTLGADRTQIINSETNAGLPEGAWVPSAEDPTKLMVKVANDKGARNSNLNYFTPLETGGKQLFYSRVYIPYLPEGVEEKTDDVELHIMLVPVNGSTKNPVVGAAKYITKKFDLKTYQLKEDTPHDPTNLDTFDSTVTWKEKDSSGNVKEYTEGKYHDSKNNTSDFTQNEADAALSKIFSSGSYKTEGASSAGAKATEATGAPGNKNIYDKLFGMHLQNELDFKSKASLTNINNTDNTTMKSSWIQRSPSSVVAYEPTTYSERTKYTIKKAASQTITWKYGYHWWCHYPKGGNSESGTGTMTVTIYYDAIVCPWESTPELHVVTATNPDISVVPNPDGNLTATKDGNKNWTIKSGYGIYATASSELNEDVYSVSNVMPGSAKDVNLSISDAGGVDNVKYNLSSVPTASYKSIDGDANATNLGDDLFINSAGTVKVREEDKNRIATSAIFPNGNMHAISAQNVTFWFPEMNYDYKFRMGDRADKKSTYTEEDYDTVLKVLNAKSNCSLFKNLTNITDNNDNTIFSFRRNKFSVNYRRLHFLPLWYPDSKPGEYYKVYGELTDIWAPTGMMTFKVNSGKDLRVEGSMWDDYKATVTEDSSVDDVQPDVDKNGNVLR